MGRFPGKWGESPGKIRYGFPTGPGKHVPRGPQRCAIIFLVTFEHKLSIFKKLKKFCFFSSSLNFLKIDFGRVFGETIGLQAKTIEILENARKCIKN